MSIKQLGIGKAYLLMVKFITPLQLQVLKTLKYQLRGLTNFKSSMLVIVILVNMNLKHMLVVMMAQEPIIFHSTQQSLTILR